MSTEPRRFADLDGIRQHEVAEAVAQGRAVDDRVLAPAAVDWARHQQRIGLWVAAGFALTAILIGVGLWLWADEAALAAFAATGGLLVLVGGGMALRLRGAARRSEEANLSLLGDKVASSQPTLAERVGAVPLALFIGWMAAAVVRLAVFVLLRLAGQSVDDPAWFWRLPAAGTFVAVTVLAYQKLTERV